MIFIILSHRALRKFLFIPWLEIAHRVCVNQWAIISYMSTSNIIINKNILSYAAYHFPCVFCE
jgi:hypothetical protein